MSGASLPIDIGPKFAFEEAAGPASKLVAMNWKDQVEPVLEAAYRLLGDTDRVTPDDVCRALDRAPGDPQAIAVLTLLSDEGYIGGLRTAHSPAPVVIKATEKGLRRY